MNECRYCGRDKKREEYGLISGGSIPIWVCNKEEQHEQSIYAIRQLFGDFELIQIQHIILKLYGDDFSIELIKEIWENR